MAGSIDFMGSCWAVGAKAPVVYFVKAGDHVKIGFTSNLAARVKELQISAV